MEKKAANPHHHVADEGNKKDIIVTIFPTAEDAFDCEPYKQDVCDCIDQLSCVYSCVIILGSIGQLTKGHFSVFEFDVPPHLF